jgi:hypothetical protein
MVKGLLVTRTITITQFVPMTAYKQVDGEGADLTIREAMNYELDADLSDALEAFAENLQYADFEASRAIITAGSGSVGDFSQRVTYVEVLAE